MEKESTIQVNNLVLIWAREQLALTFSQVVENTGITLHRLKQLESGERAPTLDELRLLSKAYKRTIATLLLKEPPQEKPLPKDRRTVDSKELNKFHPKTILAVRKVRAFLDSLIQLRKENELPIIKFSPEDIFSMPSISLENDAKKIAGLLRRKMNLEEVRKIAYIKLALELYIEKVENLGIAIFQITLNEEDKLRGFSLTDEEIPVIAIKRNDQPTGKIFTLFHELGHIILNESALCDVNFSTDNQQIEKWCNEFAGELLIPQEKLLKIHQVQLHIKDGLKTWQKKELIEIGAQFHVGPLALLRSLLENNLTYRQFYREKHEKWNKPTFARSKKHEGRNIAKETINEKGKTYIGLAFSAFENNRIDVKDLADFLGIRMKYISKTRELLYSNR